MIDKNFIKIMNSNKGCVVIMAGSGSDKPHIDKIVDSLKKYNIPYQVRICSAHKQADELINLINEYNKVNGFVVYVAVAGGTDALSGTLSFHALGPVISCPPDTKNSDKTKYQNEFNETCLKNPPGSSNAYIARPGNVGKFVAQVFAGINQEFRDLLSKENIKKIKSLKKADLEFQNKGDKMDLKNLAITETHTLPIRHEGEVHNGKVRSVYWLNKEDSERIGEKYGVKDSQLGIMVISDRISAFECLWQSKGGLKGIPGKGAALNAISKYWFEQFEKQGLAGNHILDMPHPLVWIVQRAKPVMVEAIARQYITGSMWRAYNEKNAREFCGIKLEDGLQKNQKMPSLLITPSTKGILKGIPTVPEKDDVNITKKQIVDNYQAFGFKSVEDVEKYETLLTQGFDFISAELEKVGKIFVDTKFEFGYITDAAGNQVLIYMDEIGTPDSSRMWSKELFEQGTTKEESKELFREKLLTGVPDRDVLLNKGRMDERVEVAKTHRLKDEDMMEVSKLYKDVAEKITGKPIPKIENAKQEIISSLEPFGVIEK
jgi:phosphoribosylaminoimidazole-succinocarboxamide synthase